MATHNHDQSTRPHNARLETLGTMASGIAHEINTPIQFIGDNLQFISDSYTAIDQLLKRYAALHEAAQSAEVLSEEAKSVADALEEAELDFLREELPSAIEQSLAGIQQVARIASAMKTFAHRGSAEKELADLNQAIEMTVAISRNEWKYDADLELSLDPALPKVACFVGELSQVWMNMIVNAAHAIKAKPDQTRGLIEIKTSVRNNMVEITIADDGIGMPEDVQKRVFEPFFSTKEAGKGSGQGLAISQTIIAEQHGGDIQLWSKAGMGTRFTVRLPTEVMINDTASKEKAVV